MDKIKSLTYAIAIWLTYLGVSQEQFYILFTFIILDIITGIAKQIRLDISNLRSHILTTWLLAKLLLMLVPMMIALTGKGLWYEIGIGIAWTFNVLILSEFYSCLSNVSVAVTWKKVKEFDAISIVLSFILNKIRTALEKLITDKKND